MNKKHNLPAGVTVDFDRHGNARLYFRRKGKPKVRLHHKPGSREFEDEVACARLGIPAAQAKQPKERTRARRTPGSLHWLIDEYERRNRNAVSADLLDRRYRLLTEVCASRKGRHLRGDLPFKLMERRHVVEIRDELRHSPGAQNNVVKSMSAVFAWAIEAGIATANPCQRIKRLKSGDGFHSWSVEEVLQYLRVHAAGSKARRALFLALFTGLRRSDLAVVGKQHVRHGWLKIQPGKTKASSGVHVEIPILPMLGDELARNPSDHLTFLVNDYGSPYTVDGLGNRFRKWCDDAGLTHCSLHGLRKAGATIAAENGATDEQMMAIWGWTTKQQTTLYTSAANRRRLAEAGIRMLRIDIGVEQTEGESVPPKLGIGISGTKTGKKPNKING